VRLDDLQYEASGSGGIEGVARSQSNGWWQQRRKCRGFQGVW
jgi:hypothetical protein